MSHHATRFADLVRVVHRVYGKQAGLQFAVQESALDRFRHISQTRDRIATVLLNDMRPESETAADELYAFECSGSAPKIDGVARLVIQPDFERYDCLADKMLGVVRPNNRLVESSELRFNTQWTLIHHAIHKASFF